MRYRIGYASIRKRSFSLCPKEILSLQPHTGTGYYSVPSGLSDTAASSLISCRQNSLEWELFPFLRYLARTRWYRSRSISDSECSDNLTFLERVGSMGTSLGTFGVTHYNGKGSRTKQQQTGFRTRKNHHQIVQTSACVMLADLTWQPPHLCFDRTPTTLTNPILYEQSMEGMLSSKGYTYHYQGKEYHPCKGGNTVNSYPTMPCLPSLPAFTPHYQIYIRRAKDAHFTNYFSYSNGIDSLDPSKVSQSNHFPLSTQ